MARRGENIYRRKDGRYEGRYVIGRNQFGKTRFGYVYARNYHDVKTQLLEKKAQMLASRGPDHIWEDGTYGAWLNYWLEIIIKPRIRSSTYIHYRAVARHLQKMLGREILHCLNEIRLHQFTAQLMQQDLSSGTCSNILRMLKSSLQAAVSAGFMQNMPKVKLYNGKRIHKEQRVLSISEQRTLAKAALKEDMLEVYLGLFLGLRIGEVCGLKWQDINPAEKTISIKRTVLRCSDDSGIQKTKLIINTPKSLASFRTLPVPDYLIDLLQARCANENGPYIFSNGVNARDPRCIQYRFQRMVRRLGMCGVHFHTLRHSFATRLLELGIDIKTVSILLGHSSPQLTLSFYAHSNMEQQRAALSGLQTLAADF